MANTYDSLQYPYDSFMFRDNDLTASTRITASGSTVGSNISDSASGSTSAAPASNLGDLWIRNFIRSENWKPKTTGFTIDGKTGYVEFNNLTLYGGNINYGKTSFTDSANSGYWISSSGIYIGAASDATYLKYDISSATFDLKATIKRTSDGAVCLDSLGDIINSNLNTSTQKILTDFTFTDIDYAGALKTGTVEWNTTTGRVSGGTGIVINDKGIMGALDGTEKFTLLTDGTATFAGALSAASGTFAGTMSCSGLTSGTITSKQINLSFTEGAGDCYIAAGKTDFDHDETGFIMGIDDSDSNKVKLIIGTPTEYLMVDGNTMYNTLRVGGYTPGSVQLIASNSEKSNANTVTTPTIMKQIQVGRDGTYRITFDIRSVNTQPDSRTSRYRITKYADWNYYGYEYEVTQRVSGYADSGWSSQPLSGNIDVVLTAGQSVYLYAYNDGGVTAYVRNFKVKVSALNEVAPPSVIVA